MEWSWAEERWLEASRLFDENRLSEARAILEEILEVEPGYGRAHSFMGWYFYTHLRDYRSATHHLELAIRFAPEYAPGYFHLVMVLMERRMYGRLYEVAGLALEVDGTDDEWLWEMRGNAMERIGRFAAASDAYERGIACTTNDEVMARLRCGVRRVRARHRERRGWLASLFI